MKKFIALTICFAAAAAMFSACDNYDRVSNDVNCYDKQYIALADGESFTFDLDKIFEGSGLNVKRYIIEDGDNYSVRGSKITARGTGVSQIGVTLYVPEESCRYICSLGTLYSYDTDDFTPISTAEELAGITQLDGRYMLTNDIDLSQVACWEPIGNFPAGNAFTGMFINPDGYTISGLTIPTAADVFHGPYGGCVGGLFGSVSGAFIYGVKLDDVNIDVSDFYNEDAPGLRNYSQAGGIVGSASGAYIKDCSVSGNISAVACAGGIAGDVSMGLIENCAFTGSVKTTDGENGEPEYVQAGAGGIVGYCGIPLYILGYGYGVLNCSADAMVSSHSNAGGIAGYVWGADYVGGCTFNGEVSAPSRYNEFFGVVQEER